MLYSPHGVRCAAKYRYDVAYCLLFGNLLFRSPSTDGRRVIDNIIIIILQLCARPITPFGRDKLERSARNAPGDRGDDGGGGDDDNNNIKKVMYYVIGPGPHRALVN